MAHQAVQIIGGIDPATTALLASLGGRYRIHSELGRGGFGQVFLAEDDLLRRRVAIKTLRKARREAPGNAFVADTAFLAEARMVARMEHPGIVPIYDVIELEEGGFCIISRYIEGQTLREQLQCRRLSSLQTTQIMIGLCEALNHAHKLGVVHRDVKPANIMLTEQLSPLLLDFGLARSWGEHEGEGYAAGTPGYMSPEQARGEDHLINNRSDIFSLGLVFYEMLTGQQAFPCGSARQQLELIESGAPPSPRQIEPRVPKELERICLKAMQPQIRTRYMMAADMMEDLRLWQAAMSETVVPQPQMRVEATHKAAGVNEARAAPATEPHSSKPRVVPRGLRAFDQGDADFFLTLVPGPRDRFGLPESLRFWKQRIESDDPSTTFRVGVLYGPSGCGKSSLVRAGLLPHCSDHITVLFHEARSAGNASRLARALWQKFPSLVPFGDSPPALLQKLRHNGSLHGGRKLLLVIDQAEQWLLAAEQPCVPQVVGDSQGQTLAGDEALVPSDPEEGPALLKTLRQCDGAQIQTLILVRDDFWRSISRLLAEADVELDNNNSALVDLFEPRHAEIVLESFGRAYHCLPEDPATPLPRPAREFIHQSVSSLEQDRRVSPVRLALFAEMFRDRDWTPQGLRQVGGAGGVAVTFLEESFRGPKARAQHRTHEVAARQVLHLFVPEIGDVRGSPRQQADMLAASGYQSHPQNFHDLLRVLDTDLRLLTPVDSLESTDGQAFWQLTHDHMVPALRDWLLARQAETLRGRAEIRICERAREWHARPDSARLPGVWEWIRLRLLTRNDRWHAVERHWMKQGMRRTRTFGIVSLAALTTVTLVLRELRGREHGRELVRHVLQAQPEDARVIMREGVAWHRWAIPELRAAVQQPVSSGPGLNARLVLEDPSPAQKSELAQAMLESDAGAFAAITEVLRARTDVPLQLFRDALRDPGTTHGHKLRAYAALAVLDPQDDALEKSGGEAAQWLLTAAEDPAAWAVHLRPAVRVVAPAMLAVLLNDHGTVKNRRAAEALASLHAGDAQELVRLVRLAPPDAVPLLVAALRQIPGAGKVVAAAGSPRQRGQSAEILSDSMEVVYRGQANLLLTSLSLGEEREVWPQLKRKADRTLRTFVFLNAFASGLPAERLVTRLQAEEDDGECQALLLALCGYPPSALSVSLQQQMLDWLRAAYLRHPDGGVHSSIATLLKRWSMETELERLNQSLPRLPTPVPGMRWWVTPSGIDMRVIPLPTGGEMAISAREVTRAEFLRLGGGTKDIKADDPKNELPAIGISWYEAAGFCQELSRLDRISPSQWCYNKTSDGFDLAPNWNKLAGYRLPTKAEWQAAVTTPAFQWDFGNSQSVMPHFAWVARNAGDAPRPTASLLPDSHGLWDMIGNAAEWVHELEIYDQRRIGSMVGLSFASLQGEFAKLEPFRAAADYKKPEAGMRLLVFLVRNGN